MNTHVLMPMQVYRAIANYLTQQPFREVVSLIRAVEESSAAGTVDQDNNFVPESVNEGSGAG